MEIFWDRLAWAVDIPKPDRTQQAIDLAPYYALFLIGPVANLIDIYWLSPQKQSEAVA